MMEMKFIGIQYKRISPYPDTKAHQHAGGLQLQCSQGPLNILSGCCHLRYILGTFKAFASNNLKMLVIGNRCDSNVANVFLQTFRFCVADVSLWLCWFPHFSSCATMGWHQAALKTGNRILKPTEVTHITGYIHFLVNLGTVNAFTV